MFYNNIEIYQIRDNIFSIPLILISNNRYKIIGQHAGVSTSREAFYMDKINKIKKYNKTNSYTLSFNQNKNNNSNKIISYNFPVFLLYFNQINVAHSICQLIKSYHAYSKLNRKLPIIISKCILKMPFLIKLIALLFKIRNLFFLEEDILYKFSNVYIVDYIWFTNLCPYQYQIKYDDKNIIKIFDTNIDLPREYGILYEPILHFNELISQIYHTNKDKYNLDKYENLFLVKSNLCHDSTTPGRAILLNNNIRDLLKKYNYHMILPHEITDIIKYIVLLYSSKNIITSYGGINATNRFFFNPSANVKLICNNHYRSEYKNDGHIQCSIYRANKYICFIDVANDLRDNKILEKIINY